MIGFVAYIAIAILSIAIVRRVFLSISFRASAALVLLPLLFTFRAFVTGGVYAPIDLAYQTEPLVSYLDRFGVRGFHNPTLADTFAQMIPWRSVVREALLSGEWPLINPYMLSGDLLAGSAQPAPYDFLNLAGLIVPFLDSITLTATLAFLWAGIGAFVLTRRFQMGERSALFAAACWMYSSFIVYFIEAPLGHGMLLLPLVCCGAVDVVRTPNVRRVITLAIILTWVIFTGHPEGVLQVILIGCAFGSFELWRERNNRGRALAGAVAAGVLALLCAAIFLLPILEALPQTSEYAHRIRLGTEERRFATWTSSMLKLPINVVPFVYGTPWKELARTRHRFEPGHTAAVGGVFLALAAAGAAFGQRVERRFLLALVIFGVLAGISAPPLIGAFRHIPLLALARNERFIAAAILATVLLAAMAVEKVVAGEARRIGWAVLFTFAAMSLLVLALTPFMRSLGLSDRFLYASSVTLIAPMFLSGTVLLTIRRTNVCLGLLMLCAVVQRVGDVGEMYPTVPKAAAYREPAILRSIAKDELSRFAAEVYALLPNISAHYRLQDVRGFQAMSLLRLEETFPLWSVPQRNGFNRVDSLGSPFLSFLNVRYALHYPERPLPANWRVIGAAGRLDLVENSSVVPRAFIPSSIRANVPYPASIEEMRTTRDFAAISWIEGDDHGLPATEGNGEGTVSIARSGMSAYSLQANLRSDAWIVISQPAWKGWRAFEGGREIPVRIANHAFLALRIPTGQHEIALRFRPRSFVAGAAISFATLVGVLLVGLWTRRSA
jgi:hypothetical protein